MDRDSDQAASSKNSSAPSAAQTPLTTVKALPTGKHHGEIDFPHLITSRDRDLVRIAERENCLG